MGNQVRSGRSKQARVGTSRKKHVKRKKKKRRGAFSAVKKYSVSGINVSVSAVSIDPLLTHTHMTNRHISLPG